MRVYVIRYTIWLIVSSHRITTAIHVWSTEIQAHLLRDVRYGITHVSLIRKSKDGLERVKLYSVDDFFGTLRHMISYYFPGLQCHSMDESVIVPEDERSLFFVRYVHEGTFHSALVKCAPAEVHSTIKTINHSKLKSKIIVILLNNINITKHVSEIVKSFCSHNNLTVVDVAYWLLACKKLGGQDIVHWALRDGVMELQFIDSDLDEIEFVGAKQPIVLPLLEDGHQK